MNIHDVNGSYTEIQFSHTYNEMADIVATIEFLIERRPELTILTVWYTHFKKRLDGMKPPANPTQPRLL